MDDKRSFAEIGMGLFREELKSGMPVVMKPVAAALKWSWDFSGMRIGRRP